MLIADEKSPPGLDKDITMIKLGRSIFLANVPSGTVCASSCATIWLSGDHRIIEGAPGVSIGFHAVYDVGTKKEVGSGNAILGSHLARWGFDDRAITCVTMTPPDQIGWLSGPAGSLCNITWEVLAPARTTPMKFWQPGANEGGT